VTTGNDTGVVRSGERVRSSSAMQTEFARVVKDNASPCGRAREITGVYTIRALAGLVAHGGRLGEEQTFTGFQGKGVCSK
jgi:hypothetical protein